MLVAIEGLDGCGKTTIAKMVSERLNFEYKSDYLEKMLNIDDAEFYSIKKRINECKNNNEIRALLFISALLYGFYSKSNQDICFDRSILSEYLFDGFEETEEYFDLIVKKGYVPDLTVVLYGNIEILEKRVKYRNNEEKDYEAILNSDTKYKKMLGFAERNKINFQIIDIANKSIDEVFEECQKIILEYRRRR